MAGAAKRRTVRDAGRVAVIKRPSSHPQFFRQIITVFADERRKLPFATLPVGLSEESPLHMRVPVQL